MNDKSVQNWRAIPAYPSHSRKRIHGFLWVSRFTVSQTTATPACRLQHRHSLTNGLSCNVGDVSFTMQSQTKLLRRIARIGSMNLQELEAIAERELLRHGLQDWSFGLAKTKRRQGAYNYRSKRIEIAEYYATHNPPERSSIRCCMKSPMPLQGRKLGMARRGRLLQRNLEPRHELTTHAAKRSSCPATGRQPVKPATRRTTNTNVRRV